MAKYDDFDEFSAAFRRGIDIVRLDELPDDAVEQLDALRENVPKSELDLFDLLYETVWAMRDDL